MDEFDPEPEATESRVFIECASEVEEPWQEGLIVMHNPNARFPLDDSTFADVTQVRGVGKQLLHKQVGRKIFNQRSWCTPKKSESELIAKLHALYLGPDIGSQL